MWQRSAFPAAAVLLLGLAGVAHAECTPSADCETAGSCADCSFRGVCSPAGLCVCDRGWGKHPCSDRVSGLQSQCVNAGESWTPATYANVICDHCASPRPSDPLRGTLWILALRSNSQPVWRAQGSGMPHPCYSESILSLENKMILAA
jgi:hypothetical protein